MYNIFEDNCYRKYAIKYGNATSRYSIVTHKTLRMAQVLFSSYLRSTNIDLNKSFSRTCFANPVSLSGQYHRNQQNFTGTVYYCTSCM